MMSDASPFPAQSPPTPPSLRGILTMILTLVICAFLSSSLYTTYTHCGFWGAVEACSVVAPLQCHCPSLSKSNLTGVLLWGEGLLRTPRPPPRVVECALLYLLNKACSLLTAASRTRLCVAVPQRACCSCHHTGWGLLLSGKKPLRGSWQPRGHAVPETWPSAEGVGLSLNLCGGWDTFHLPPRVPAHRCTELVAGPCDSRFR